MLTVVGLPCLQNIKLEAKLEDFIDYVLEYFGLSGFGYILAGAASLYAAYEHRKFKRGLDTVLDHIKGSKPDKSE